MWTVLSAYSGGDRVGIAPTSLFTRRVSVVATSIARNKRY
jgi:hypothetical protein